MARRPQINVEKPPQAAEIQLILACARRVLDPESAAAVRARLDEALDWNRVLSVAAVQRMLPLLHWHVGQSGDRVPTWVREQLRERFFRNLQGNLWLTGELLRILPRFAEHQIPAVPFKGPVLTASLYDHLGLRDFADLDVLTHKSDVLRAKAVLMGAGYEPEFRLTPSQEAALLRDDCEYNFRHPKKQTRVEVHWRMGPRSFSLPLDPDPWWHRLQQVSLSEKLVPTFSSEDLLVLLCLHGGKHYWERLSLVVDVSELLRQNPNLDWERVFVQARQARVHRMLLLGLHLAHDLLDAPLPERVLGIIGSEAEVWELENYVQRQLGHPIQPRGIWFAFRFFRKARESLWDRVRFLLLGILTPTPIEWSLVRLPGFLYPLYAALRVGRLVMKSTAAAARWVADRISSQP